jgi:hypothetical protein
MRASLSTRFVFVLLLGAASALPSIGSAAQKPHRAALRFLARGTDIHSSFSGNHSEYLVQMQTPSQSPILARLLYRRPFPHPDIPDELIDSGRWNNLRVTRAPDCDQNYATLSTRWLPAGGESLRPFPGLRFVRGTEIPVVAPKEVLPCYRVESDIHWNR